MSAASSRDAVEPLERQVRRAQMVQAFEERIERAPIPWETVTAEMAADAGDACAEGFIATWERMREKALARRPTEKPGRTA